MVTYSKKIREDKNMLGLGSFFGSKTDAIIYLTLFILIESVFLNSSFQIVTGPILTVIFLYLYFCKKKSVLVTTFIIVANDALGTIFFGKISFQYLLLLFLAFELVTKSKIRVRYFILAIIAVIMAVQPYFTSVTAFKSVIYSVVYIWTLITQYQKYEKDEFIENLMFAGSIIVGLIALHAIISGGVVYIEAQHTEYYQEYQRRGILGAGIGDPNFSSLLLCTGIVCTVNNHCMRWYEKSAIYAITTVAMSVTLSASGILAFVLVNLLSVVVNRKLSKGLRRLVLLLLIGVGIFQIYLSLPEACHIADIDAYIEKMEIKYNAFVNGDFYSATTGRLDLADKYLHYINQEQTLGRQLFGGNSVVELGIATHNTYLSWILQFGYLGFIMLLLYACKRLLKIYLSEKNDIRRFSLIIKALYLFFIATLSVFDGSTFALMFFFLFVL